MQPDEMPTLTGRPTLLQTSWLTYRWLWKVASSRRMRAADLVSEWAEVATVFRAGADIAVGGELPDLGGGDADQEPVDRELPIVLTPAADWYSSEVAAAHGISVDELLTRWTCAALAPAVDTLQRLDSVAAERAARTAPATLAERAKTVPRMEAALAAMGVLLADDNWHSYSEVREAMAASGLDPKRIVRLFQEAATDTPPLIKRRRRNGKWSCRRLTENGWPAPAIDLDDSFDGGGQDGTVIDLDD